MVRNVASTIKDEAKNIGVILEDTHPLWWYGCKFLNDLSGLDASETDKKIIETYLRCFAAHAIRLKPMGLGKLQITEGRGCITETPDLELDKLFDMFVESEPEPTRQDEIEARVREYRERI